MPAPSFVAAGSYLTEGYGTAGSTAAVFATPAGVQADDIVLIVLYKESTEAPTVPAGFNLVGTPQVTTGSQDFETRVYWRRATASEPTSYSFGWSTADVWRTGFAIALRGADPVNPVEASSGNTTGGTGTTTSPAVLVATSGDERLLVWFAGTWDRTTWTTPSGFTDSAPSGAPSPRLTHATTRALTTERTSGTVQTTTTQSFTKTAHLLAIKPAVAQVADTVPSQVVASDPGGETVEALTDVVTLADSASAQAEVSDPAAERIAVTTEPDPGSGQARSGEVFGEVVDVATAEPAPAQVQVSDPGGEDAYGEELTLPASGRVAVAIFHVDPATQNLTPLPHRVGCEISPDYKTAGAVRIEYPKRGLNSHLLWPLVDDDAQVEIEIWLGGRSQNAMRAILTEGSCDDVSEQGYGTFAGQFVEYLLDGLRLRWESSDPEEKGATVVNAMTPGEFVGLLMTRAQQRGALGGRADFVWDSFNNEADSNGNPWTERITGSFAPGPTYREILADLAESAVLEFEVATLPDGRRDLRLYTFGSRGRDRTTGTRPAVLRRGRNFLDVARKRTSREVVTDLEVYGKDGLRTTESSAAARARYGRVIEGSDSVGEIDVPGALEAWAEKLLQLNSSGLLEVSAGLVYGVGDPQPQNGFKVADWVLVDLGLGTQDRPALEPMRVAEWSLTENGSDQDGTISLNDLIEDWRSRIRRRLDRMQRGSVQIGSSTSPPRVPDTTAPGQPTGLVVSSAAYQDDANIDTWATLHATFVPPATNADNSDDPRTIAAQLILDRIEAEQPILEDWSWTGAPQVVLDQNDYLHGQWLAAGGGTGENQTSAKDWLTEYLATNGGAPTPVDDVAGFQGRYRYLGLTQTGGPGEFPGETGWLPFNDTAGPSEFELYTDGLSPGAAVEVQVRAFDDAEVTNYGPWSASAVLTTAVDNVPPNQPSTPATEPWFGTARVHVDGTDVDGVPLFAVGSDTRALEVHMSTANNFTVVERGISGSTYLGEMYGPGVWNEPDLPYGVAHYFRLVAVDHAGNRSAPSSTSAPVTVDKLVNIDIGPNAIDRAQIIDGEIVNAKIANLAVNDAKILNVEVGKLITGTLEADMIMAAGQIQTGADTNNGGIFDAAGIRFKVAGVTTIDLNATDGSALITGTYRSGLTGERINILPDGTLRLYPAAGNNYSQIANNEGPGTGPRLTIRAPLDGSGYAGYINLAPSGVGIFYGPTNATGPGDSRLGASYSLTGATAIVRAGVFGMRLDGRQAQDGNGRRVFLLTTDSSGNDISDSLIHMMLRPSGGPMIVSPTNNAGIVLNDDVVIATTGDGVNYQRLVALGFDSASSETLKEGIAPVSFPGGRTALDIVRGAPSKDWYYTFEGKRPAKPDAKVRRRRKRPDGADMVDTHGQPVFDEVDAEFSRPPKPRKKHRFPIAEDLLALDPELVSTNGLDGDLTVDLRDMLGVLWAAVGELAARVEPPNNGPKTPKGSSA